MSFVGFLYNLVLKCLYPTSVGIFLIACSAMGFLGRRSRRVLLSLGLGLLLICGNGWVVEILGKQLERECKQVQDIADGDCILVLGGGTVPPVFPRRFVEVSEAGDRIIYASRLFRMGKAHRVICSSGVATGGLAARAPAEDMADLMEFFGVPREAIILEKASGNTREHARNLAPVFLDRGFKRVLLVTSAMHMPRSIRVFRKQCPGVEFIQAPTDFRVVEPVAGPWYREIAAVIPTPSNLHLFTEFAHEYLGMIYYRMRGWI